MRLAAIDIGTNSVHMIVVQVRPDLSFEVIDREKEMVRLGAGGLEGREITATASAAALTALARFKRVAESHEVDEILAAATSATREAANGPEFLADITRQTGIRARVISGYRGGPAHPPRGPVRRRDGRPAGRGDRHRRGQRGDHARRLRPSRRSRRASSSASSG